MASEWQEVVKSAQKTCLLQDGRRKIHYAFKDGSEMAEEYDVRNHNLIVRMWKKKGTLGGAGKWDFEVGEQQVVRNAELEGGLVESATNPIFIRKDSASNFEWRIRNLPYPLSTYDVSVNSEARDITIKTSNKKYYKKFQITDMDRLKLPLNQSSLSIAHANNTLIITYKKPSEVLQMEKAFQVEFSKMKTLKEGDMDTCNPS